jgi:hypothetical protein
VGSADPKHFTIPKMPVDWVDQIVSLYKFRNKAAHEGRAFISDSSGVRPLATGELQSFIFSAEVLFRWSSDQRLKLGFSTPALSVDRSNQIIAILGEPLGRGGLVLDTSESFSGDATNATSTS